MKIAYVYFLFCEKSCFQKSGWQKCKVDNGSDMLEKKLHS